IFVVGVDNKTLSEIYKFPYSIQQLIVTEVSAIKKRIEKSKEIP
ncbi:38006_t:CDS:1, partial [Gigaspora margarita]